MLLIDISTGPCTSTCAALGFLRSPIFVNCCFYWSRGAKKFCPETIPVKFFRGNSSRNRMVGGVWEQWFCGNCWISASSCRSAGCTGTLNCPARTRTPVRGNSEGRGSILPSLHTTPSMHCGQKLTFNPPPNRLAGSASRSEHTPRTRMPRGCPPAFRSARAVAGTGSAKRRSVRPPSAIAPVRCHVRCCASRAKAQCGGHADLGGLTPRHNHGRPNTRSGRWRGRPRPPCRGGMASTSARACCESLRLAAGLGAHSDLRRRRRLL